MAGERKRENLKMNKDREAAERGRHQQMEKGKAGRQGQSQFQEGRPGRCGVYPGRCLDCVTASSGVSQQSGQSMPSASCTVGPALELGTDTQCLCILEDAVLIGHCCPVCPLRSQMRKSTLREGEQLCLQSHRQSVGEQDQSCVSELDPGLPPSLPALHSLSL